MSSMFEDEAAGECPLCEHETLVPHCDNIECLWEKCTRPSCKATVDYVIGAGFGLNPRNPEWGYVRFEVNQ